MAQNMSQANIGLLPQWRALGNTGDLPAGWTGPGSSSVPSSSGGASTVSNMPAYDPIATAKQAQQLQINANQPAIQTLNTQKSSLDQKYDDLLKSIDSSQQVSLDSTTRATATELAKRGITSDSGISLDEQAARSLPVTSQFGQLKANTGLQRQNDLTGLATTIAGLQAGNIPGALNFSSGIGSLQNQAQSIANSFTLENDQNAIARDNLALEREKLTTPKTQDRYLDIGSGGLYDTKTGQVISGIAALKQNANNSSGW